MSDRIEKSIELAAPVDRVWRALTDHTAFGRWFGVAIEAPFVAGETSRGHMTIAGLERVPWNAEIERIEPQHTFAYRWHPYAINPDVDYSGEPRTLVEFRLEPSSDGTRLTIVESGFEHLPPARRVDSLRMNDGGWTFQLKNIVAHVET